MGHHIGKKKIIISNSESYFRRFIKPLENKHVCYVDADNTLSPRFKESLHSLKFKDLTKKMFSISSDFKEAYCRYMRVINRKNSSLEWWAMNFTNKNPLLTTLYSDSFYVVSLADLAKTTDFEYLFVLTSNIKLARRLKSLGNDIGADIHLNIRNKVPIKELLIQNSPMMILYAFVKVFLRKILYTAFMNDKERTGASKHTYLIATQFENKSFSPSKFEDLYFRQLRFAILKKGASVITVGYVNCSFKKLFTHKEKNVFPFDSFITYGELFKLLLKSLRLYLSPKKPDTTSDILNIDLSALIKSEISLSINSGQIFVNLMIYHAALNLIREYNPHKIFYPFENRSWEKMIILAAGGPSKDTKLVGYQHASLTPKHVNFHLEQGEYKEIPFPDEIVTTGYATKDIMSNVYNFPKDRLKVGCALRQTLPDVGASKRELPRRVNRVLVALASNMDEYLKVLKFLDRAFEKTQAFTLAIRPHPGIDFNKAIRLYKLQHAVYELDKLPLYESLKMSDIVLYASSTVSLEAISIGIPVIYIDLEGGLSSDPLFTISHLKWACKEPSELNQIVEDISKTDEIVFLNMKKQARKFSENYCVAATEDNMKVFL